MADPEASTNNEDVEGDRWPSMKAITRILNAIEHGKSCDIDALLPVVYKELRHTANQELRKEGPGHTLQGTALVHEAYRHAHGRVLSRGAVIRASYRHHAVRSGIPPEQGLQRDAAH